MAIDPNDPNDVEPEIESDRAAAVVEFGVAADVEAEHFQVVERVEVAEVAADADVVRTEDQPAAHIPAEAVVI